MTKNPVCFDCGRIIGWDEAIAIPLDSKRIAVCPRCYQESLMAIKNPRKSAIALSRSHYLKRIYPRMSRSQALTLGWAETKKQKRNMLSLLLLSQKKKNPTKTEKAGNILGGLGLLAIPLFIGLIWWISKWKKE